MGAYNGTEIYYDRTIRLRQNKYRLDICIQSETDRPLAARTGKRGRTAGFQLAGAGQGWIGTDN